MKIVVIVAIAAWCGMSFVSASAQEGDDPCKDKVSNLEMRECYTEQQVRVSAEADSLANKIAASFRKNAEEPDYRGPIAAALRKAASAVIHSQKSWRTYRNEHCNAVAYSFTNGSGAGTAFESCLFQLGQGRVLELRSTFEQDASK